jgi:hypothetical protein
MQIECTVYEKLKDTLDLNMSYTNDELYVMSALSQFIHRCNTAKVTRASWSQIKMGLLMPRGQPLIELVETLDLCESLKVVHHVAL